LIDGAARAAVSNLYRETACSAPPMPPLLGDARADIAVIGGGFTGLSTALHAAEGGATVALVEAEDAGFGASGRNGGQVNPGLKLDPDVVERDFGPELGARMNAFAGSAPSVVFDLIERYRIDCGARRNGTLRAAAKARHAAAVRTSAEQFARRGAPVELLEGAALARITGTEHYAVALLDRRGGDLNPLSFARGLARAALAAGARLHGGSRALAVRRSGEGWRVDCASGSLTAAQIVIATNGYTDGFWPRLRRTIVPLFGAICASEPLSADVAGSIMPTRCVLYESGAITVYYRVDAAQRLLIGGRGPQYDIDDPAAMPHLTDYAVKLWPELESARWTHAWGGRLAMTRDHYPHVHEPARGVCICLGYNGRGVAMATALGAALARRVLRPSDPFDMPVSGINTIAMHSLWPLAVRAAILRGRISDYFA
jgi:glycine/D-amino acid oxidase-like deaminating enzyme